jgi:hypothetical protein
MKHSPNSDSDVAFASIVELARVQRHIHRALTVTSLPV